MNMKNAITYKNRNGYLYPLLALPAPEETPIGKYGRMYLDYLKASAGYIHFSADKRQSW